MVLIHHPLPTNDSQLQVFSYVLFKSMIIPFDLACFHKGKKCDTQVRGLYKVVTRREDAPFDLKYYITASIILLCCFHSSSIELGVRYNKDL
jgi:hypothetical protein